MAQNWTDNTYAPDHVGQTDLQNIEYNFACLKSMFSGGSAPSNPVAGMPWFDTTQLVLKIRNSTNNAWLGLMHGDTDQKVWVYRDGAMDGWAVDSSITDRVIAIKGGSQAYNVSGGNLAGTWQQSGHALTINEMPAHDHGGGDHRHREFFNRRQSGGTSGSYHEVQYANNENEPAYTYYSGNIIDTQGGGQPHNHGNTWRPAAAVGTLQYLDL